jgi:hypothetical protein
VLCSSLTTFFLLGVLGSDPSVRRHRQSMSTGAVNLCHWNWSRVALPSFLLRTSAIQRPSMLCERFAVRGLTNRSSGRVKDKVPSSYTGARAAQLNR